MQNFQSSTYLAGAWCFTEATSKGASVANYLDYSLHNATRLTQQDILKESCHILHCHEDLEDRH